MTFGLKGVVKRLMRRATSLQINILKRGGKDGDPPLLSNNNTKKGDTYPPILVHCHYSDRTTSSTPSQSTLVANFGLQHSPVSPPRGTERTSHRPGQSRTRRKKRNAPKGSSGETTTTTINDDERPHGVVAAGRGGERERPLSSSHARSCLTNLVEKGDLLVIDGFVTKPGRNGSTVEVVRRSLVGREHYNRRSRSQRRWDVRVVSNHDGSTTGVNPNRLVSVATKNLRHFM